MNSLQTDDKLRSLLDRLHTESEYQQPTVNEFFAGAGVKSTTGTDSEREVGRGFWLDKFVALDRDKAELCYSLVRSTRPRRILEAGTSFGVSTLYLAAAVRDIEEASNEDPGDRHDTVIATELEKPKAEIARRHFEEAGLSDWIDLRVGDIRKTVTADDGPFDFVLFDIWAALVAPVITTIGPTIPIGGIVIADNIVARQHAYVDLVRYLDRNGFFQTTLPYQGGLLFAVRTG